MKFIKSKTTPNRTSSIFVECVAEIRNNETGEVREYDTEELLEKGEKHPSTFNWEEHNFSCDCNRTLFFKYANNEDVSDDEFDNIECSGGKFSVNLKNKKDGKLYYKEFIK
jgi:hypothetical protein